MTEVIEGESRELAALAPAAPARLSAVDPGAMIEVASKWATALKRVVEAQKLYAIIQGKKYPQVEAWTIVGRMDNTAAQEESVTRQEDGSYVATAILVRLSDGAIVGRASALCGAPDDRPWNSRPEYNRRSMAVTRAISRAFRAQYSWIMALAGYEPTPAEEMPLRQDPAAPRQAPAGRAAANVPPHSAPARANEPPALDDADLDSLFGDAPAAAPVNPPPPAPNAHEQFVAALRRAAKATDLPDTPGTSSDEQRTALRALALPNSTPVIGETFGPHKVSAAAAQAILDLHDADPAGFLAAWRAYGEHLVAGVGPGAPRH